MKSACLAVMLVAGIAGNTHPDGVGLEHATQHTNTSDVRAIGLTPSRVWVATGGGLTVHNRADGRFLFKLTSAHGLPGNSLRVVTSLPGDRLVVGGDFGAAVLRHANRGQPGASLEVLPIRDLTRPDMYTPVSALLGGSGVAQDGRSFLVLHQLGRVPITAVGPALQAGAAVGPRGWWSAAAARGDRIALGEMAGRIVLMTTGKGPARGRELVLDGPVLSLAPDGEAFVAATGEALYRIEGNRLRQIFLRDPATGERPLAATVVAAGPPGTLLVGTAEGVVYRLREVELTEMIQVGARITALRSDGERLWVGADGLRLASVATGELSAALQPRGEICGNHVTKLTRHRRWLVAGTFDRGACVLTRRGWVPLTGLPSPMVLGLASDGRDLYVATASGIARFGRRLQPRPIGERDAKTLRWLATEGATGATRIRTGLVAMTSKFGVVRVWRRKHGRTRIRFMNHDEGAPGAMTGIAATDGTVFVGSETQGVKRLSFGQQPAWQLQDHRELPENWVTDVAPVAGDEVWVATCQSGAAHVKGDRVQRFGIEEGLPDRRLTAVAADDRGAFLGTLGGLAWVATGGTTVRSFGLPDGLPDPRSAALHLDGESLWVGTEAGLARFKINRPAPVVARPAGP